ncbi:MAG: hypothetical protein ACI87E_000770 [Mariniblastus sp.]
MGEMFGFELRVWKAIDPLGISNSFFAIVNPKRYDQCMKVIQLDGF